MGLATRGRLSESPLQFRHLRGEGAGGALDQGADAMVIFSTTMAQVALNLTIDMADPPILIFNAADPYAAGLARATCIKPPHVTGTHASRDYKVIFDALELQVPGMETVGLLYSIGHAVSEEGARKAEAVAQSRGIEVIGSIRHGSQRGAIGSRWAD